MDFFGSSQPQQMQQPVFQQPQPQRPMPVANQAAPRPAPQMAVAPARPAQPATPPPTFRLQSPDEPAQTPVARLALPSPEQMGVGATPKVSSFDWALVHRRLDQLGCSCFQMEQLGAVCKLVCLLPTGQSGQNHRIEVQAADSAEAARLLLQQADAWVARK